MPDKISEVVDLWKHKLAQTNEKAAQSLADPKQYENLFPGKSIICSHFFSEWFNYYFF